MSKELALWPVFIRALIPFMRALPSGPNYHPKVISHQHHTEGLDSPWILGDTNIQPITSAVNIFSVEFLHWWITLFEKNYINPLAVYIQWQNFIERDTSCEIQSLSKKASSYYLQSCSESVYYCEQRFLSLVGREPPSSLGCECHLLEAVHKNFPVPQPQNGDSAS